MAGQSIIGDGKKLVGPPDLEGAKRNIRAALGDGPRSAGTALVEGLEAYKGHVDGSLDSLRADARAAKEGVDEAGRKLDAAKKLVTDAQGKVEAAEAVVRSQSVAIGEFLEQQTADAREIKGNAEAAETSARESSEAVAKVERAAVDLKEMVDSVSILVGKDQLKGPAALEKISSIVAAVAEISITQGQETLRGPDAVAHVIRSLGSLQLMRGAQEVNGMEVFGEIVSGIGSITVTRPIESKPTDPSRTEVIGHGLEQPSDHSVDLAPAKTTEQLKGFEALAYVCSQVENIQDASFMRVAVSVSFDELFAASVQVPDGTGMKVVRLKGVELLGHMFDVLDKLKFELPEQTRKAIDEVFTSNVIVDGKEQKLSGADLVAHLISEVSTAKKSAGSAVREAEEAKVAARKAEGLVEEARALVTSVDEAVDAAFKAVDQKLGLLFDVLTGKIQVGALGELAELFTQPSYQKVAQEPAKADEVKG